MFDIEWINGVRCAVFSDEVWKTLRSITPRFGITDEDYKLVRKTLMLDELYESELEAVSHTVMLHLCKNKVNPSEEDEDNKLRTIEIMDVIYDEFVNRGIITSV